MVSSDARAICLSVDHITLRFCRATGGVRAVCGDELSRVAYSLLSNACDCTAYMHAGRCVSCRCASLHCHSSTTLTLFSSSVFFLLCSLAHATPVTTRL